MQMFCLAVPISGYNFSLLLRIFKIQTITLHKIHKRGASLIFRLLFPRPILVLLNEVFVCVVEKNNEKESCEKKLPCNTDRNHIGYLTKT